MILMDGTTKRKMNSYNNFQAMDLLNLIAFYAQLKNIEQDVQHSSYIHNEIAKLHNENDIIMQQNKQILNLLNRLMQQLDNDKNQ